MKLNPPCGHTDYAVSAQVFYDENDVTVRCNECKRFWVHRGDEVAELTFDANDQPINPFGSDSIVVEAKA